MRVPPATSLLGDLDLLERIVREDPKAIARHVSKCEQEQTALHYVVAPADDLVGGLFRTVTHDLHTAFYNQRQFGVVDPDVCT